MINKVQIKYEYFRDGVDDQKHPDIIIDLRRPDVKTMNKWSKGQRKHLTDFISACESAFASFITEIKKQTNDTTTG